MNSFDSLAVMVRLRESSFKLRVLCCTVFCLNLALRFQV